MPSWVLPALSRSFGFFVFLFLPCGAEAKRLSGGIEKYRWMVLRSCCWSVVRASAYAFDVYLVTALVPSETACLASSPGRMRRTAVWISRDERVPFLL